MAAAWAAALFDDLLMEITMSSMKPQGDVGKDAGAGTQPAQRPGDEAPAGTPGTGEALCRKCGGSGRADGGAPCPECGGTGKVNVGIGGA